MSVEAVGLSEKVNKSGILSNVRKLSKVFSRIVLCGQFLINDACVMNIKIKIDTYTLRKKSADDVGWCCQPCQSQISS